MKKSEFYARIPLIKRRLFTRGLPAAAVFLTLWYLGGYHLWGYLLDALLFPVNIDYDPLSTLRASLLYGVEMGGRTYYPSYLINQFNSNMVMLVTLLATWPHESARDFFKVSGWCLFYLLLYQFLSIFIQLHHAAIGPDLANRAGVFWEETNWYLFMRKLAAFDKFIMRFFFWIPIYMASLVTIYFMGKSKREAS
ncbi:MAG: hypothetical protein QNK37_37690 [Acidobacteriota bacterium]|nr:hypothetical protein [Acidobacteriota bacterium]